MSKIGCSRSAARSPVSGCAGGRSGRGSARCSGGSAAARSSGGRRPARTGPPCRRLRSGHPCRRLRLIAISSRRSAAAAPRAPPDACSACT
eukprot:1261461-Prymnesium_polylepis.1